MDIFKTKYGKMGIIFSSIGVTALLCVILFWIFGAGLLQNASREFEAEQMPPQSNAISESLSIPGFETMTIPADKNTVPVYFYNPEGNPCYFEISLIVLGKDEEIYKSKLVSPGQELYQIELTKPLSKGTYDAIIHYNTFALSDYSDLNGANVPFKLIVE